MKGANSTSVHKEGDPILCGFRRACNTQHALLKLLQAQQKELDKFGDVGTILMNI